MSRKRSHGPSRSVLLGRIRGALSVDLLHSSYPPTPDQLRHSLRGHGYVAAEAAYHLFGKSAGLVPYASRRGGSTHWWLVDETTGEVLDPIAPQGGGDFPYAGGKRRPFRTPRPSRRAVELMRRVRASL